MPYNVSAIKTQDGASFIRGKLPTLSDQRG